MNGLRSFSARDFDDSGTAVIGLGLLARVDDTADEATTDEGWDGEVALLEDALRYARMVSVAYGHLVGNLLMFPDLDTSSRSTEDSFRAQVVQEKLWRLSSTDFLGKSKNDIQYVRIRVRRSCQCFFLFIASVVLSCSWSERVCAVPEALRSRAFGRDARESHSKMGLKVCKVAVQWICRFERTSKRHTLCGTTGIVNQLDFVHLFPFWVGRVQVASHVWRLERT